MARTRDVSGKRFGKLIAIEPTDKYDAQGSVVWIFKCDCGNIKEIPLRNVTSSLTKSCGCLVTENALKMANKNMETGVSSSEAHILKYKQLKNNTSGYKGVLWDSRRNKWIARIQYKGKRRTLAMSKDINDCIQMRKLAEDAVKNGRFEEWVN